MTGWRWSWWRLCWVPSAPASTATLTAIYKRCYTPQPERPTVVYAALRKDPSDAWAIDQLQRAQLNQRRR